MTSLYTVKQRQLSKKQGSKWITHNN